MTLQIQKLTFVAKQRIYPLIVPKRNKVRKFSNHMYDIYQPTYPDKPSVKRSNWIEIMGFIQRTTLTLSEVQEWAKWKNMEELRKDQRFLPARHKALGPDLATAHFLTVRGAKIKFKGNGEWLGKDAIKSGKIPSRQIAHLAIESVDASGTQLCYEGFDNLIHLFSIKELILRNCEHIDDFALSRLHLVQHSLEVLDVSGCHNVTEKGLCTLHLLKYMKKLIIHDLPRVSDKELTCLLLQDVLPECEIEGVDYDNLCLLRRLKKYM